VQDNYPSIPWPKVVSMRNRLIHGYDNVDIAILWDALKENIPELLRELEAALRNS
jgi:uncharacterized protein with HEPN domain